MARLTTTECTYLPTYLAGVALPAAPRQGGSALQELQCLLPEGSEAVHCRNCTAHCPQAVRQYMAGVVLPTAPRQWCRALQELHCPLPPGSEIGHCRSCAAPCPQGSGAEHCRNSTGHCPRAVRQCIAGVPLPTAPRQ